MHCGDFFNGLQFDQYNPFNQQIRSKPFIKLQTVELNGNRSLPFHVQTFLFQHFRQYHFIYGFQQTRPKLPV